MRCYLYIRVSSEEQAKGHSPEFQEDMGLNYIAQIGGVLTAKYQDIGKSAYQLNVRRDGFERMVADARAGGCDAIVMYKIDRFARRTIRSLQELEEFARLGIEFHSLCERMDFTTPEGKVMFTQFASWAQYYSEELSRKISQGKHKRAEKGWWNGDVAFGYAKVPTGEHHSGRIIYKLDLDPIQAPAVQRAFEMCLSGYSALQIAQWLNSQGFKPRSKIGLHRFSRDGVRTMLENTFYTGVVKYKSETYPGKHPAIITPQVFEQARAARRRLYHVPNEVSTVKRIYPLAGILYCTHCGRRLNGQALAGGVRYYRDTARLHDLDCPGKQSARAEAVEDALVECLGALSIPPGMQDRILKLMQGENPKDVESERQLLRRKLARLKELYLEGDIQKGEYADRKMKLDMTLRGLETITIAVVDMKKAAETLSNFKHIYVLAQPDERRRMFRLILQKAYIDYTGSTPEIVAIQPTEDFYPLLALGRQERSRLETNTLLPTIISQPLVIGEYHHE